MSYVNELFDLAGEVAVITGGAGGIGAVYAEALCASGAAVVIADVNGGVAEGLAAELVDRGHRAACPTCRWRSGIG